MFDMDYLHIILLIYYFKGLIVAVNEVLPEVEHRMCAQHILSAWRKKWRGDERRKKFWECAYSTFKGKFKDNLIELDKLGEGIIEDLLCYPHQ